MVKPQIDSKLTECLQFHAGLTRFDENSDAIAACYDWRGQEVRAVGQAVSDLLVVLEQINRELRASRALAPKQSEHVVPLVVAYSMAEILFLLRRGGETSSGSKDSFITVETAWRAVLDGDIEDISTHVALERRAGA